MISLSLSPLPYVAGWFEFEYLFRVVKKRVGLLFLVFKTCCGRRDGMFSLYTTLAAVSETSLFPLFETRCGRRGKCLMFATPAEVAEMVFGSNFIEPAMRLMPALAHVIHGNEI